MIQKAAGFVCKRVLRFPGGHPYDYCAHFTVSFVLTVVLFFFVNQAIGQAIRVDPRISVIAAVSATLLIGIRKELDDIRLNKTDSIKDMLGNIIGISLALVPIFIFITAIN